MHQAADRVVGIVRREYTVIPLPTCCLTAFCCFLTNYNNAHNQLYDKLLMPELQQNLQWHITQRVTLNPILEQILV